MTRKTALRLLALLFLGAFVALFIHAGQAEGDDAADDIWTIREGNPGQTEWRTSRRVGWVGSASAPSGAYEAAR